MFFLIHTANRLVFCVRSLNIEEYFQDFATNISKTVALDKKNRALDNLSGSERFSGAYLHALDDA